MTQRARPPLVRAASAALAVGVALALGCPATAAAACGPTQATVDSIGPTGTRGILLCLVNVVRAQNGLRALSSSRLLATAAQRHGEDMVARRYFDHVSPNGGTVAKRVRRTGYLRRARVWWLGENLGWAEEPEATPGAVMQAWMESPGHRAVILQPHFRQLGIGLVPGVPVDGAAGWTFVLDAGVKKR